MTAVFIPTSAPKTVRVVIAAEPPAPDEPAEPEPDGAGRSHDP